jgi:UDP-N-acetylglucosamine diphosphorylase/glucosamine-1-phosphate N-acetyltransferase
MNYILVDPYAIEKFYPFTLTRPLGEMRLFGGTIKELWEKYLGCEVSYLTQDHLAELYRLKWSDNKDNVFIPSHWFPLPEAKPCDAYINSVFNEDPSFLAYDEVKEVTYKRHGLSNFLQCFQANLDCIAPLYNKLLFDKKLFGSICNLSEIDIMIASSYKASNIDCSKNPFLNDDDGPIIIGEDVTIMEGAMIRGPVHICKGSTIKMGAKIYGPTVIGPYCKIGGEVSNCIFLGYSNKAHEGFLGHSIIGEWCNIGAGTSNSNLKNDYGTVKMWDYKDKKFQDSGSQFLGLYMGDHSKCAINTSFNTGTTVGVNCNIFGSGFPRNFIHSFSWGGSQGVKPYNFEKAISVAEIVMERRGVKLTEEYIKMLRSVHDITSDMK